MAFSYPQDMFPDNVFEGLRAINVQTYLESNVKLGVQFVSSSIYTGLTAGENLDIIVITGDKPVALKAQYIASQDSGNIITEWYRDPVYTGGVDVSSGIFNQSDINPVTTTVQLIGVRPIDSENYNFNPDDTTKPVITNKGTRIQPLVATLGSTGQGSGVQARSTTNGLEHNLRPNTTYLLRRHFIGATNSFFGFSTWYEGGLDLPRPY